MHTLSMRLETVLIRDGIGLIGESIIVEGYFCQSVTGPHTDRYAVNMSAGEEPADVWFWAWQNHDDTYEPRA